MTAVDGGVIEAPAGAPLESRLARIHAELEKLIAWHEPAAVALEDLYFGKNVRSAIAVGQARGVAMLAAGQRADPVLRLHAPGGEDGRLRQRRGRQAPGPADGRRAARARRGPPESDHTADALAVAICHAGHAQHRAARSSGAERPRWAPSMIASVRGEVLVRRPDHVVIESAGVGYRLTVSAETLKAVPASGKEAILHAHLVARDDSLPALRVRLRGGARPVPAT